MESNFETAVNRLLLLEGGYSNHPNDKGGATNFGITQGFLKGIRPHTPEADVDRLTKQQAIDIYKEYFWDHYHLDTIQDAEIATKLFCMLVNKPPSKAIKILQTSINELVDAGHLIVDGVLGPRTLTTLNLLKPSLVLAFLTLNDIKNYVDIVSANPSQNVFLLGWCRRAFGE